VWSKVKSFFYVLYRRLRLVDWLGAALAILRAAKKEKLGVDPKYIVVKPRVLSDENYLRGVSLLRGVLSLIPPAAIGAPILGLGSMGFKIWKHIALKADYDRLQYPPVDPNMLRLSVEMEPELKKHYGQLILGHNWNDEAISELEVIYNDFQFLTDFEMLRAKYPHISEEYTRNRTTINKHNLQQNLSAIEQGILQVSHTPEINHDIRDAFESLRKLFPAMQDWALFNSEGFNDILDIIDTIF